MSLDTFKSRNGDNVPGKFYVGDQCTDCDLCRETAPDIFGRNDEHGYSYVKMQPQTAEQEKLCQEAAAGCCVETIHDDGDAFDWIALPAVPTYLHPGTGGQAPRSSCCEKEKNKGSCVARGRLFICAAIVLFAGCCYGYFRSPDAPVRGMVTVLNNIAFVAVPLGIPLFYAIRTGRFFRTMLLGWLLFFFWFVLQAFVAITIAHRYYPSLEEFFSDGPAVAGAIFVGPIFGGIVGILGLLVRKLRDKVSPSACRTLCKPTR